MDPDKCLYVFVSHRHEDHFSDRIFELARTRSRIVYILSDDIWENRVPLDIYGKVFFMGPDEEESFAHGGGQLFVRTYQSTDEGVAFLIDAEGKRIYHAGDLNNWSWDDGDKAFNSAQTREYGRQLDRIAAAVKEDSHVPDLAFVPVDSRLGQFYDLGADAFMKKVGAAVLFPMHTFDGGEMFRKIRENPHAAPYAEKIRGTGKENESCEV